MGIHQQPGAIKSVFPSPEGTVEQPQTVFYYDAHYPLRTVVPLEEVLRKDHKRPGFVLDINQQNLRVIIHEISKIWRRLGGRDTTLDNVNVICRLMTVEFNKVMREKEYIERFVIESWQGMTMRIAEV